MLPLFIEANKNWSQERKQEKIKLMKKQIVKLALAIAVVGGFALSSNSAKAVGYSQGPPAGNDTGAEFLITWDVDHVLGICS